MRVLFISWSLPGELNAYTHRLYKLAEGIRKHGYETEFFYLPEHPELRHTMVPTYISKMTKKLSNYDLIHAGSTGSAFVASLVKPFVNSKLIYDIHGDRIAEVRLLKRYADERLKLGRLSMCKVIVREVVNTIQPNYFLAVSENLRRKYIARGIPSNKIIVLRNGVDTKLFSPGSVRHDSSGLKICYAGGFQKWQAIDDLCTAAEGFIEEDCEFHFVGCKPEDNKMIRSIRSRLNDNAIFVGKLPQIELVEYLRECDFLVLPRKATPENRVAFPTKFAEYISVGKPVIVSRVGEIAELTERYRCGLVCDANAAGLSRAIEKALSLSLRKRKEMGDNGRRLAETSFDWALISKEYDRFIKRISCHHKTKNTKRL